MLVGKDKKGCRKILTGINMRFIRMQDFEVSQIYPESVWKRYSGQARPGIL